MRLCLSIVVASMFVGVPAEAAIRYLPVMWSSTRTATGERLENEPYPPAGWTGRCYNGNATPHFFRCVDQPPEEALLEQVDAGVGSADVKFTTPWFGSMFYGVVANDIRRVSFQISAYHTGVNKCLQVEVAHDNGGYPPKDTCFNEFSSPDGAGMHWIWNPKTNDRAFDLPKPSGGWTWPILKNTMFNIFVKNKGTSSVAINSIRIRIWHY
jgi:hypothetical protein